MHNLTLISFQELHDLDLQEIKLRFCLSFYQQVKLINYIRRQVIIEDRT